MNPYEVLEIQPGASADEIKAAYHRLAKHWHPDRYAGDQKAQAEARFRELAEAFSMLKDATRRSEVAPPAKREGAPAPASGAAAPPPPVPMAQVARTPQSWFEEAKLSLEQGDPERASGLAQYAIRLDASQAHFHVLHAQAMKAAGGDPRLIVKSLETAIQLNSKDVDSMVMLAEQFQSLGMQARANGVLAKARALSPSHVAFKKDTPRAKGGSEATAPKNSEAPGLGEQVQALADKIKGAFSGLRRK